jgi:hypothetical protein
LTPLLSLLAAEFPDEAFAAEFAVEAGVGAGLAEIQALLAVTELHLLAADRGVPVRVKTTIFHKFIITNGGDNPKGRVLYQCETSAKVPSPVILREQSDRRIS